MSDDYESQCITHDWMTGIAFDADLLAPIVHARLILNGWSHEQAHGVWNALSEVLRQWKADHGMAPEILGIPRRFEDIEPWECAGTNVADVVDLVVRLDSSYPPFRELLSRSQLSMSEIYAVICLRCASLSQERRTPGLQYVMTANPYHSHDTYTALKAIHWATLSLPMVLHERQLKELVLKLIRPVLPAVKARKKQSAGLQQATMNSAEQRKRSRELEQNSWKEMAAEKWPNVPDWTNLEMAEWIETETKTTKAISSIEKAIQGVKMSALRRARRPKDG